MNQTFSEKLQSILDNQMPYYGDDGITRTQAKQAILKLIKESIPEFNSTAKISSLLNSMNVLDISIANRMFGWNNYKRELLKRFGMEAL